MTSAEIRRTFLSYFESKGHKIVPSAPLVLKSDPSLLFTNSGMVQFKDYFLGVATPPYLRVADTQKCLRVSGKHNDLEDVGLDTYHHTMFEMLGNWSFGDYFKKEAIAMAWELLTTAYKLPPDRLYVTVFGGDAGDKLPLDAEAEQYWQTWISPDRILYGDKKDNFWEMGDSGPCGPCSEIHVDLRSAKEIKKKNGRELINTGHPQVIEIWNLVFIQFNRLASGALSPLEQKHVDTGMGFERLCMAIQNKLSNYETDLFTPLIAHIEKTTGLAYGKQASTDVAMRVLADHIRAVAFAIADGQLPSNTGAGYVIRRILRRAVRYAYSTLGCREPLLARLIPILAQQMQDVFPELIQQQSYVETVIFEEEQAFLHTLEKGLKRIDLVLKELAKTQTKQMSGDVAFELFDTYGFPLDLTQLIAKENGVTVHEKEFEAAMTRQRNRSKADAAKENDDWTILTEGASFDFVGYDTLQSKARVTRYRKVKQKNKWLYQVVLDKTPFYAEGGGQVGDVGVLESAAGAVPVLDTKKENNLTFHLTETLPPPDVLAKVNESLRAQTACNHSATHLLHAALRRVLGKHVEQKGSLVKADALRFDFSHFAPMTAAQIRETETLVNKKIRANLPRVENRGIPIEEAKKMGAMALFGEKYGERVRVITFGTDYSVELCGGIHVPATGHIGLFKILGESSVAAGVRRIEAVTGVAAEQYLQNALQQIDEIKMHLKNPRHVVEAVENLLEEKKQLEKKIQALYHEQSMRLKDELAHRASRANDVTAIIEKIKIHDQEALKDIAYALRSQFPDLWLVLAANVEGRPAVAVMLGEKTMALGKYHAGNMVKELAKDIGGGGGGQDFFAMAGGKNIDRLDAALSSANKMLYR